MKIINYVTLFALSALSCFTLLTATAKADPTFYENYTWTYGGTLPTVTCPEDYLIIIAENGVSSSAPPTNGPTVGGVSSTLANYSTSGAAGLGTAVYWLLSPKGGFSGAGVGNDSGSGIIDIFYGTKHVYVDSVPDWNVDESADTTVPGGVYYTGLSVPTYADHGSVVLAYVDQRDYEPTTITPSVVAPSGATYTITDAGSTMEGGLYLAGGYSSYVDAGDTVTPYLSTGPGVINYNAVCVDIW